MSVRDPVYDQVNALYEVYQWRNAYAILKMVHPAEWDNILAVLVAFRLTRSDVISPGGNKSPIARHMDDHFVRLGWRETKFNTRITVDLKSYDSPTHKVDCFKSKVAVEMEWNNKDPFYDRDLNNFRLLFDLRVIDVGVIITRSDELQTIFNSLGKGSSYGNNTTRMGQLLPRIEGGGGGGCPVMVFGITKKLYEPDR